MRERQLTTSAHPGQSTFQTLRRTYEGVDYPRHRDTQLSSYVPAHSKSASRVRNYCIQVLYVLDHVTPNSP